MMEIRLFYKYVLIVHFFFRYLAYILLHSHLKVYKYKIVAAFPSVELNEHGQHIKIRYRHECVDNE